MRLCSLATTLFSLVRSYKSKQIERISCTAKRPQLVRFLQRDGDRIGDKKTAPPVLKESSNGTCKRYVTREPSPCHTTDYIVKEESVYADGVEIDGGFIKWNAVEDKNHCYYRVFTSNEQDFIPSVENQIASTVATSIKSDKVLKYVKVVSVDKSGNM